MDSLSIWNNISPIVAVLSFFGTLVMFFLNRHFQKEIKRDKYDKIINDMMFSIEELRFYASILWICGNEYKQIDEFTEYVNKYMWKLETDFERLIQFKEFKKFTQHKEKLKSQISATFNIISNDNFECKNFKPDRNKENKVREEINTLLKYLDEIH